MTRARSLSQLANSSVFTVATNNRVGIGSEIPTTKLDVDGALNVSGNAAFGGVITYEDVTNIDSVGIITARSGVSVPDNQKIQLGTGNDLQIYHTGSHSLIDEAGTGNLTIRSSLISFEKYTNEQLARFTADGSCELFHDNSKKFETTSGGISVTGAGTFASNLLVGETTANSSNPGGYVYSTRWQANDDVGSAALNGVGSSGNLSAFIAIDRSSGGGQVASIDYDGAATFAGTVGVGAATQTSIGVGARMRQFGDISVRKDGTVDTVFSAYKDGTAASNNTVNIKNDGSATFASDIEVASKVHVNNGADGNVYLLTSEDAGERGRVYITSDGVTNQGQPALHIGVPGQSDKIALDHDGSATFAGSIEAGYIKSNRTSSSLTCFEGQLNGSQTSKILASGAATFAGRVKSGNILVSNSSTTGVEMFDAGQLLVQRTSTNLAFGVYNGTTKTIDFQSNGAAEFNHYVISKRYTQQSGLSVNYNGIDYGVVVYDTSELKAGIKLDGSVSFARGNFQMDTSGIIQTNLYSAGTLNIDSTGTFGNPKIVLNATNASATFNGTSLFKIHPDSTVAAGVNNGSGFVSQLNHDGSATFGGDVICANSKIDLVTSSNHGEIRVRNSGGSLTAYINGNVGQAGFGSIYLGTASSTDNVISNTNQAAKIHLSGGGSGSANIDIHGASHSSNAKVITFGTNNSERMRISSTGTILNGNSIINDNTNGAGEKLTGGGFVAVQNDTVSSGLSGFQLKTGSPTKTLRMQIMLDGDLQNANNSYTGISDIKLKENIVDANSQWDDIKSIKVRNYNFKPETNLDTHKQIGLIAQEIETVCPGLVGESPDRDENDNDLGTVTKSVNYSVLYMKAVKALQEAMDRIETLETKVAALEG